MALQNRLDARSGASQLAYSSFDSGTGRGIEETNPETGQTEAMFGTHFDGTHGAISYTGPIPPVPSKPDVPEDQTAGIITTSWDGNFAAPDGTTDVTIPSTLDWTHVEVHLSRALEGFTAEDASTLVATINTARGGVVSLAAAAGTWYVKLVSRSSAGKRSEPSLPATVVVTSTVDTAAIEADLDLAQQAIIDAKARADQAFNEAGNAFTAAGTAQTTATNAATAAGTAQTTATNAAAAAGTAQTTATNAATAAGTAQTTAGNAATAAANALKKFTVSANVPSGTGNAGDVWWRKDGNGAIIGQWEWATTPTPAGWKPRTTDGGIISNMAVTNLVAGTGTMATGVIDKLFSDVVVARMAIAQEFIGTNAIITGAITAPKITASEELTAKVAQFLTVNAGMVNTNSLWADAGWIAAARSHILTVLSNTNGDGYTSTITGQGLRVTKTVNGKTIDMIRLGTFGADYLGISDGNGRALVSMTGEGNVGAQAIYADDDVFVQGRQLGRVLNAMPKGEVGYGETSTAWSNATATNTGIMEMAFWADPGRAYTLKGNVLYNYSGARSKGQLAFYYTVGGAKPQIGIAIQLANATDPLPPEDVGNPARAFFEHRFVPVPLTGTNAPREPRLVRVLMAGARNTATTGTFNVTYAEMRAEDIGYRQARQDWSGVYAGGTGASTLPDTVTETVTMVPQKLHHFKRGTDGVYRSATASWDNTIVGPVLQGQHNGEYYKTYLRMFPATTWLGTSQPGGANYLRAISAKLTITPDFFDNGVGSIDLSQTDYSGGVAGAIPTTQNLFHLRTPLDAWGQGVTREILLSQDQLEYLQASANSLTFGFGFLLSDAQLADPRYIARIPANSISLEFTYLRKV